MDVQKSMRVRRPDREDGYPENQKSIDKLENQEKLDYQRSVRVRRPDKMYKPQTDSAEKPEHPDKS